MDEKNIEILIKVLVEKIKAQETEIYFLKYENERLKGEIENA